MKPKDIATITKTSESYVYKVKSGDINKTDKAELITMLLDIDTHLIDIIADDRFYDLCETAIAKSRSIEVRKFAVRCQHISEIIKNKNKISQEEKT